MAFKIEFDPEWEKENPPQSMHTDEVLEIPEWLCKKLRGSKQQPEVVKPELAIQYTTVANQMKIASILYQKRIDVFLLFLEGLNWSEEVLNEMENSAYEYIIGKGIFNFEEQLESLLLQICEFLIQRKIRAEYVRKMGIKKMLDKYENKEIPTKVKLQMSHLANQIYQGISQSKRVKTLSCSMVDLRTAEMKDVLKELINLYIEN